MAKKSKKPTEPPPFEPDPLPDPTDHPAPEPMDARVAKHVPLTTTTPVLVRLANDDYAQILIWAARQNESAKKRLGVVSPGKGPGLKPPDFIRQAIKEKLAHLSRSAKK